MKTKQFIKYFKDEGFGMNMDGLTITLYKLDGNEILEIEPDNNISTFFDDLPFDKQKEYYKVIFEYLMTPIEDREEEEKYYYKLKGFDGSWIFLIKFQKLEAFVLGSYAEAESNQSTFTDKEFEALPDDVKSHNWEKIKVERED